MSDKLPLRYRMQDGKPVIVLPYEWIADDNGDLQRIDVDLPDVQGFGVWVERYVEHHGVVEASIFAEVDEGVIRRWVGGGRMERGGWAKAEVVELARVDQILLKTDTTIWDLYPYLQEDLEVDVSYCHRCREDVMPIDGICPWCETRILDVQVEALPVRRERRSRRRGRKARLGTVRRPKVGVQGWAPIPRPVCELKPVTAVPVSRSGRARRVRLEERLVYEAAWRYYLDEWSFNRIAAHLFPLTRGYRDARSLSRTLHNEFKFRGWPRRDRIEATRMASYKHGLAPRDRKRKLGPNAEGNYRRWLKHHRGDVRPRCRGTVRNGPRKGERCLRPSLDGQHFCASHQVSDELRAKRHRTRLEELWAGNAADMIPAEPLAAWLDERRTHFRTGREMAARVAGIAGNVHSAHRLVISIRKRRTTRVRRETVDRILEALGDGITAEELYAPFIRREAA